MRLIDKRLRILRKKVKEVEVIDTDNLPQSSIVSFGALVTIEDEDGNQITIRLVDHEESDPELQLVSVQSPVGKALLGQEIGDDVEVHLPKGTMTYEIIHLHYGPDPIQTKGNA